MLYRVTNRAVLDPVGEVNGRDILAGLSIGLDTSGVSRFPLESSNLGASRAKDPRTVTTSCIATLGQLGQLERVEGISRL